MLEKRILGGIPLRVLHGDFHFIEKPQIVKFALRIKNVTQAQRLASGHLQRMDHGLNPCMFQTTNEHALHHHLFALNDFEMHIDPVSMQVVAFHGIFHLYVGISAVQVEIEHAITVRCER